MDLFGAGLILDTSSPYKPTQSAFVIQQPTILKGLKFFSFDK